MLIWGRAVWAHAGPLLQLSCRISEVPASMFKNTLDDAHRISDASRVLSIG
jgi:hypothetical protein